MKLLSRAYLEGEAGAAPELQLDQLAAYGDGLIALTGGPEGPVGRALASGNRGRAEGVLDRLRELFPGRLYIELMRHGLEVRGPDRAGADRPGLRARAAAGRHQRRALPRGRGVRGARRRCCASPTAPTSARSQRRRADARAPAQVRRRDARAVRRPARGLRQHAGDRPALRLHVPSRGADPAGVSDQPGAATRRSELRGAGTSRARARLRAHTERPACRSRAPSARLTASGSTTSST